MPKRARLNSKQQGPQSRARYTISPNTTTTNREEGETGLSGPTHEHVEQQLLQCNASMTALIVTASCERLTSRLHLRRGSRLRNKLHCPKNWKVQTQSLRPACTAPVLKKLQFLKNYKPPNSKHGSEDLEGLYLLMRSPLPSTSF